MTEPPVTPFSAPPSPSDTARRAYELFCLAALMILLMVLMERDYHLWALLPCLFGLGGVAGRWSLAVPMVLVALVFVLLDLGPFRGYRGPTSSDPLSDLLLCASVLGYAAAQYRLQGLAHTMVPADRRRRRKSEPREPRCRRGLGESELLLLLLALPVFAWLAPLVWDYWYVLARAVETGLPRQLPMPDLSPAVWRLLVLLWIPGLALLLWQLGLALCTWKQRGRTPEEAVLFMQDLFWRETRGEQRRLFRWLTRTRLRHERREERS
jgi:hypothetical protein